MTPSFNRAQRSALHAAMLAALDLPTTFPEDDDSYRAHAWCETIAWAEYPEDVLELANVICTYLAGHDYVEVDAADLRRIEGAESVNLALRLNGIRPRPLGRVGTVWTNCPLGARGKEIKLPVTLIGEVN